MQRRFQFMATQVMALRWSFVFMSTLVAAVGWQGVPPQWVLLWLGGALLVFGLRARWLVRHAAMPDEPSRSKVRGAVLWNAALGLAYGLSAIFMLNLSQTMSAVLTTVMVSSAAGAVAISGPLLPVYLAFTLGIMFPFAAMWAASGSLMGIGLALLMGIFVSVQYRFARKVSQTFTESFLIRRENEQLVAQLTAARDRADAASIAKTRFLAAASHDLRQPLHALSLQSSAAAARPRMPTTRRRSRRLSPHRSRTSRRCSTRCSTSPSWTPARCWSTSATSSFAHAGDTWPVFRPLGRVQGSALRVAGAPRPARRDRPDAARTRVAQPGGQRHQVYAGRHRHGDAGGRAGSSGSVGQRHRCRHPVGPARQGLRRVLPGPSPCARAHPGTGAGPVDRQPAGPAAGHVGAAAFAARRRNYGVPAPATHGPRFAALGTGTGADARGRPRTTCAACACSWSTTSRPSAPA